MRVSWVTYLPLVGGVEVIGGALVVAGDGALCPMMALSRAASRSATDAGGTSDVALPEGVEPLGPGRSGGAATVEAVGPSAVGVVDVDAMITRW